jgi:hypothetical protein
MVRLVVNPEQRLRAEIVLRSAFRKRSVSPREVALLMLVLDRVWACYEELERQSSPQPSEDACHNGD